MRHGPGFIVGGIVGFGLAWAVVNKPWAKQRNDGPHANRPSFI